MNNESFVKHYRWDFFWIAVWALVLLISFFNGPVTGLDVLSMFIATFFLGGNAERIQCLLPPSPTPILFKIVRKR